MFKKIISIDQSNSIPDSEKLRVFYNQRKFLENTKPFNDSAYVLVLLKISKYEFTVRNNFEISIQAANRALDISRLSINEPYKTLTVNCYYNLASAYQKLMLYQKALAYFDTVLQLCNKNFIDTSYFRLDALYNITDMGFFLGDYQKVIDESNKGIELSISQADSGYLAYFLNRKAQSLSYINYLGQAFKNVIPAIGIAKKKKDPFELATSYKTLGFIYEKKNAPDSAGYYLKESIKTRKATNYYGQIANDYIDLGNFYLNSKKDYTKAQSCYYNALFYAAKIENPVERSMRIALANLNLGESFLVQKKIKEASAYFLQSFSNLQIKLNNDIKNNPASILFGKVSNKDLVIILMNDKTNLLLQAFKSYHDPAYLKACIRSALVTDSVITQIRHEQSGEQSKLYWRNKTRDFYTNSIEACYLDNNPGLAFFFMEKSRAVLLNDKLNELNASSYLSKTDAAIQESYEIKIVDLEQKLSVLNDTSGQYKSLQHQYLSVKNAFEQFIKSLEKKYPVYYQYKYADAVPTILTLQQFLAKNKQSFVHYFLGDTVTYILAITPWQAKISRLSLKDFNKESLSHFLQLCASKEELNNHYAWFAQLSHSLYLKLFQPLHLSPGRIIICADNYVIPFEALCKDESGRDFLLNDFSFSYVYSARYLMKKFNNPLASGNFVGYAPVTFEKHLDVNDLKNAADALKASAAYYKNEKLFLNENANKNNFFGNISSYLIASVFSHARADTSGREPILYMQDSLIHLSELQLLNKPATRLVILSACQTNVGKFATGEGIYSLARGFATAGIPAVAGTLWKADEQSIYAITKKFNEYLSEGMRKDEALQKAKFFFIQNSDHEKLLPYYWANMIVIGNSDSIQLIENTPSKTLRVVIYLSMAVLLAFVIIYNWRKIKRS